MRKLILVAAVALISTAARAGDSRGLSLASPTAAPSAAEQSQNQTKAPPAEDKSLDAAKPRRKHLTAEARIIRELHRHGIYW